MATAGSGDVLTGIIAAILAKKNVTVTPNNSSQKYNNISEEKQNNFTQKVAISSLIHSLAGDNYAEKFGLETLTASDLIENLKFILN
jgi:NAD(P)H-hydrate repair Nnr-like enzyme with NAD(P)H-hydrate dehydratase domain